MTLSIRRSIRRLRTCIRHSVGSSSGSQASAATARFPGAGDFGGSYDPRSSDAQDGGQSTYNGSIAVTLLDRGLVANVLPGNFRLAPRQDGGSTHPVIHLVGHQRELMLLEGGITLPAGDPEYQEVILLIPFVVRGAGTKLHTCPVRMYLNEFAAAAISIGNTVYAYAKLPAELAETGTPDDLTTRVTLVERVFENRTRLTGPWRTSDDAQTTLARWIDLQEIFAMPLVGLDVAFGTIVRAVCSYWEWDYTNAEVAPATSQHRFFQPFREGMEAWPQLGPLSSAADGAVAVRGLRWRLARPPPPCLF